ncbi:pantoate--beta-alanine ligase [Paenibacillus montaniterrae]|uniref:Pantothenate synthetase n=1 Tax=Paenibacillus montaniterrae TaxID=429341 RepID=A0A919YKY6_9BACL|nr:pantoate--beta-alanine ligase [Paenibacillus montaniterrae]GIP15100.1 pantoate--beta-alanine ligase [Paenibacillus montaniterrae]
MNICRTKQQLKLAVKEAKGQGKTIGFVPTMGYLHEGHASLLRAAREENDIVVLSIFVNPMQFGPNEDLDRYPRDEQRDVALAAQCGTDIVFIPSVQEMYPSKPLTSIKVAEVSERLCGASRPGHFDGVGLVVSKLFHLVEPTRAYFGLKDAQQVAVIEQMVADLDMNVEIVPCPIVREPDGLALSSRNVYLSAIQRSEATVLSESLSELANALKLNGAMTPAQCIELVTDNIKEKTSGDIDYVELLEYPALMPVPAHEGLLDALADRKFIVALAVRFGSTRLIDNALFHVEEVIERV